MQNKYVTKFVLFTSEMKIKKIRNKIKISSFYRMQTKSFVSFPLENEISVMEQKENEL